MQGLLSIYFVRKSLRVTTINKELSLQYGDIVLTKKTNLLCSSSHNDCFYEAIIDMDIINTYIQQNIPQISEYKNIDYHIIKNAPYQELTHFIIKSINTIPQPPPRIRIIAVAMLLSIIREHTSIDELIISSIPSLSDKVRNVISSNPSKKWMLHNIATLFHMSESLFKKKLLEEETSFSEILLQSRMNIAKKILEGKQTIKQTSINCGFSSVSYFIQSFKRYYGITPKEYQLNIKRQQIKNIEKPSF